MNSFEGSGVGQGLDGLDDAHQILHKSEFTVREECKFAKIARSGWSTHTFQTKAFHHDVGLQETVGFRCLRPQGDETGFPSPEGGEEDAISVGVGFEEKLFAFPSGMFHRALHRAFLERETVLVQDDAA